MTRDEYEKYRNDEDAGADTLGSALATKHGTTRRRFNQEISLVVDNTTKFEVDPPPQQNEVGVAYEVYE
jgi:hypothetical protein